MDTKDDEYLKQYNELKPTLDDLLERIIITVNQILKDSGIKPQRVYGRVKDFDTTMLKIEMRRMESEYEISLDSIEDLCAMRVVCTYDSECDEVVRLIAAETGAAVKEKQDISPDRFEYRDRKLYITVEERLGVGYKVFIGRQIEIQVHTLLSFAWEEVSHKLAYRQEVAIKSIIERRLNGLSALLELADRQFDILRDEVEHYTNEVTEEAEKTGFAVVEELNFESLQVFLKMYFPRNKENPELDMKILDRIIKHGLSLGNLEAALKKIAVEFNEAYPSNWSRGTMLNILACLTSDTYWDEWIFQYKNKGSMYAHMESLRTLLKSR